MTAPTLDEVLALDAVCLRDPTGGPLDMESHRIRLASSMANAQFASVRRKGALIAYGYMWPLEGSHWFVGGLAIHPEHRNPAVVSKLFSGFASIVTENGATELHSHVLANNSLSRRLHQRLGFRQVRRSDTAIAFAANVSDLLRLRPIRGRGRSLAPIRQQARSA